MNRTQRQEFLGRYRIGLSLVIVMYLGVTILRSVRSDFAPEIWQGLGASPDSLRYFWTELLVAVGVLALNGAAALIADNRRAFFFGMSLAIVGAAIMFASPLALSAGASPLAYMVLQGLGLYLPYIAVHTTIFERLIAMTRQRANLGYLMYLADAFGYLGYVAVLLARNLARPTGAFFSFYQPLCAGLALACIATMVPAWKYFSALRSDEPQEPSMEQAAFDGAVSEGMP
jgi:hypothetical protein